MQPNPYSNVLKGSACGSLLPFSFPVKHLFWAWAMLLVSHSGGVLLKGTARYFCCHQRQLIGGSLILQRGQVSVLRVLGLG